MNIVAVTKKRRLSFDQAQDERLSIGIANYAIPFVLSFSKHERIFSHVLCLCGDVKFSVKE